jgi:hypothetical protein
MSPEELVRAAQDYDYSNRPYGKDWKRVPDSQVARFLTGARLAVEAENKQRRAHPVTKDG